MPNKPPLLSGSAPGGESEPANEEPAPPVRVVAISNVAGIFFKGSMVVAAEWWEQVAGRMKVEGV